MCRRAVHSVTIAGFAVLLAACAHTISPSESEPSPREATVGQETVQQPDTASATSQTVAQWQPPKSCPYWADEKRPEGSNCYGIKPEVCGADKAAAYVGMEGTAEVRAMLEEIAVAEFRWLPPRTAYNENLYNGRLNVILNDQNIITRVDCY